MPAVKNVTSAEHMKMMDTCHCFIPLSPDECQFRNHMQKIDQNLNGGRGIAVTWESPPAEAAEALPTAHERLLSLTLQHLTEASAPWVGGVSWMCIRSVLGNQISG